MNKKFSLNLDQLQVQSFVTALDERATKTVDGGTGKTVPIYCPLTEGFTCACPPTIFKECTFTENGLCE